MTTDPFLDMAAEAIAGVASDDEARGVIAMIEAEKRRYRAVQMFGGALPPGPLEQALELDGDFRVRAHLTYLSERIAAAVERVESGESVYLRVSMPPRYGKTRMIGWATPVWLLRKHPDWSIVITSNESNLATLSSRQVRRTIENDPGLGVDLAADAGAVQEWETSRGGGVVARGLVGNLVGRGARCVSGDTRILTDRGYITAERAFDLGIARILAYDHVTNRAVWRRVEAAQRAPSRRVVEVTTTSGRVLTCTPDHPIYTSRGYVPAGQLRNGETLVAVMDGRRVPPMPDALPATDARPSEVDAPGVQPVLHAGVRGSWTSGYAAYEVVPLREGSTEERRLLLTSLPCRSETPASTARQSVRTMWGDVPAPELTRNLLLAALLQRSSFDSDAWQGKLSLQDGDLVQQMVPVDAATDPESGWSEVRRMRGVPDRDVPAFNWHSDTLRVDRAPHQRTSREQPATEPHYALSDLSCCAPQIQADTVALVRSRGDETHSVYDFQVEGARNFFADGVLVHNCLIMDDMVKSFVAAHSPVTREAVWNWWLNVAQMRLEHPVLVIAVGCLTSGTPVLLADGTERRIENVRPGDRVVAYEGGRLVNRAVLNWANQGPDHVYSLRMESGRVVRANARHPFLTVDSDGSRTWKRMDRLNAGEVILRATGASGGESLALTRAATAMSSARGCAPRTTTKHGGQRDTTGAHLKRTEGHTCATGTALTRSTSGLYSLIKVAPARSVNVSRTIRTPEDVGFSSLITATTLSECAACSAMTATSSSDTARLPNDSSELSSTYALTTDRVESVVLDGYEDVFDIEVEGAHTFIANGLVTHNTRWHQDDFLGRLGSDEYEGDPGRWEDISLPAFAEPGDLLGRTPGEPLISPLRDETPTEATETLEAVKVSAGTYAFAAQFQARPAPAQGAIFDTTWWRYWTTNPKRVTPDDPTVVLIDPVELVKPNRARVIESWDCAFKDTDGSDYVVGQWWAKQGVRRYLLDQTRNRLSFNATVKAMQEWAEDHRTTYARYVEDKANGTAVIDVLKDTVEGMLPINPTNSKEARARAVTPECEAGNVYLPHPSDPGNEWVADLLSELRQFPHDVHDDQCLIGETLVDTPAGSVPLDTIHAGDIVRGLTGWVAVLKAGQTGTAAVMTVAGLTGTANHPVWTEQGWLPLSSVTYDDVLWTRVQSKDAGAPPLVGAGAGSTTTVGTSTETQQPSSDAPANPEHAPHQTAEYQSHRSHSQDSAGSTGYDGTVQKSKRSSIEASHSGATRLPTSPHTRGITSQEALRPLREWKHYTEKSSRTITARYPMDGTSTTETTTSATTTRRTLWCYLMGNTAGTTIRKVFQLQMRSGSIWPASVRWLRRGTHHLRGGSGTVSMPLTASTSVPVFNLTTSDGTYFANGILVHNCDALTQALTQLRDTGEVTITVPGTARGGNPLVAQHSRSLGKRPNVSPIRRTR